MLLVSKRSFSSLEVEQRTWAGMIREEEGREVGGEEESEVGRRGWGEGHIVL